MAYDLDASTLLALNRHGVLFKKRVLRDLRSLQHLDLVGEEVGVTFGGTRVLDMLFRANFREQKRLVFSIECKKVQNAHWVFFQDTETRFRTSRDIRDGRTGSAISLRWDQDPFCCSDGYELREKDGKHHADQDPLFKAASQLSYAFLGFVKRRLKESRKVEEVKGWTERHIPVLITNAELFVAPSDYAAVSLQTGEQIGEWKMSPVDVLALNHPSPSPGEQEDFREESELDTWNHLFKETIWIVNSSALGSFFSQNRCEELVELNIALLADENSKL